MNRLAFRFNLVRLVYASEGLRGVMTRTWSRIGRGFRATRMTRLRSGELVAPAPPGGVFLSIDWPKLGDTHPRSDWLYITGWAASRSGSVTVLAELDGHPLPSPSHGDPRPDVAAARPDLLTGGQSGFVLPLNLLALDEGPHELLLRARDSLGNTSVAGGTILVDHQQDAYSRFLQLDAPRPASGSRKKLPAVHLLLPIPPGFSTAGLGETLNTLFSQSHSDWSLTLLGAHHGYADPRIRVSDDLDLSDLSDIDAPWIGWLSPSDRLMPNALERLLLEATTEGADLVYGDEDRFGIREGVLHRHTPWFKPNWSPELLLSTNYIGRPWLARGTAVRRAGGIRAGSGSAADYDLLLRLSENAPRVAHVAEVLCSRLTVGSTLEDQRRALEETLARRGLRGRIDQGPIPNTFHTRLALTAEPKVSLVIPTRAGTPKIRACLASIRDHTDYANLEILLVDNADSTDQDAVRFLEDYPATRIRPDSDFNWSRYNNLGAKLATGDVLVFLNDDIEPITPHWVQAMLELTQRPTIGAVGAKLLYANNRIQHVGCFMVNYGGGWRHAFRHFPHEEVGPLGLAHLTRDVAGVTGACMMVRRDVFERLRLAPNQYGGFDEGLQLTHNDVDFCMRVRAAELQVVVTPHALLYHHERTTRHDMPEDGDARRYWRRWRSAHAKGDPFFNPNLAVDRDDFTVAERPARR